MRLTQFFSWKLQGFEGNSTTKQKLATAIILAFRQQISSSYSVLSKLLPTKYPGLFEIFRWVNWTSDEDVTDFSIVSKFARLDASPRSDGLQGCVDIYACVAYSATTAFFFLDPLGRFERLLSQNSSDLKDPAPLKGDKGSTGSGDRATFSGEKPDTAAGSATSSLGLLSSAVFEIFSVSVTPTSVPGKRSKSGT